MLIDDDEQTLQAIVDDYARQRRVVDHYRERGWEGLNVFELMLDMFLLRPSWRTYARMMVAMRAMDTTVASDMEGRTTRRRRAATG